MKWAFMKTNYKTLYRLCSQQLQVLNDPMFLNFHADDTYYTLKVAEKHIDNAREALIIELMNNSLLN